MDVAVAAPQRSGGDRGRFGGAVGNREVERLIGQEDHAPGKMPVHHRLLARAVADAQKARDVVLEGYGIVFRVRRHRVGKRVGGALCQQRRCASTEHRAQKHTGQQIFHNYALAARVSTVVFRLKAEATGERSRLPPEGGSYLRALTAACATTPSCWLVPPDAPLAPTIFPPDTSGIPPSTGMAPSIASIRSPSPPAANASCNAYVGRLKRAAERAVDCATWTLPTCVSSIFSK